ncbi:E3 ubiquitin-protein ligase TRIM71-like [Exaiptasia diaphana]|uniref:E3 ubiquitin-protein ligase TRIM71 n=1 Tax=Exaiptasia diaphana TaxID=2652724 RepID=A0A913YVY2_EXADI|nr:E3 ubiquitin-protein ligase TRIM71-like [Exaiptasia diaphana]
MKTKSNEPSQQQLQECVGCSKCDALVGFCPQCEGIICDECMNAHRTVTLLIKSHKATLWSEFNPEVLNSFVNNQAVCKEKFHMNSRLEYYCKTCKKCICQKCGTTAHSSHDKVSIEEAAEDAKNLIRKEKDRLNELIIGYKKELELSNENMRKIESEVDTAKDEVHSATQALMKILQYHEDAVIAELDHIRLRHKTNSEKLNSEINADIEIFSELKQKCETMDENKLEHFILESYENLQDVCKTAIQNNSTPLSTKPNKHSTKIHYISNPEVIPVMQKLKLGEVVESVTDPLRCSINSLSKSVWCGFTNEFVIETRNSAGDVCHTNKDIIDVQIQDVDGNDVQKELTATETETGRFLVKYKAEKPSPYKVVVSIGGKEIMNSPQTVKADVKTYCAIRHFGKKRLVRPIAVAINDQSVGAVVDHGPNKTAIVLFNFANGQYKKELTIGEQIVEGNKCDLFGVIFSQTKRILVSHNPGGSGWIKEFDIDGNEKRTLCTLPNGIYSSRMCKANHSIACLCWNWKTKETFIKLFSDKKSHYHLHDIKLDVPDDGQERPFTLAYDNNKYFVSFFNSNTVYVFNESGNLLYTFGGKGKKEGQFDLIRGLAVLGKDLLAVCDRDNHRVQVFSQSGHFLTSFGTYGSSQGEMDVPVDIAITQDEKVFVLELDGKRVQEWKYCSQHDRFLTIMEGLHSFTSDFEAQLTCAVCNEIFTEPRTLPCLHTFCFKCIKGWNETCQKEKKTLKCPTCRAAVNIEGGDIANLPSSFTFKSLLQLFDSMKMKADEPNQQFPECSGCSNSCTLIGFCPQCGGMICDECMNEHRTAKVLIKSHKATLWNEFNPEVLNSFVNNQAFCKEKFHVNCRLEFYCKTCKKCICNKCSATAHGSHDKVSIEEAAEDAKKLIRRDKDRLNELIIGYKKQLQLSNENMRRIQSEISTAKAEVRNHTQNLIKILQDHEDNKIATLDFVRLDRMSAAFKLDDEIRDGIQTLSELKQKCETMEENNLEHFILESSENLQDVCKTTIQKKSTPLSTKPEKLHYMYIPNPQVFSDMQEIKLGDVVESLADASHCSIEDLTKSVICGVINEFLIVNRDSDGNVCPANKDFIDVKIQDADNNDIQIMELTETETGRFLVKYKAEKPSQYKVMVSIVGKEIKNSPQTVTADVKTYRATRTFGKKRLVKPIGVAINDQGVGAVVDHGPDKTVIALFNFANGQYMQEFSIRPQIYALDSDRFGVIFNQKNRLLVCHNLGGSGCIKEFDIDGTKKRTVCILPKEIYTSRMCKANHGIACLCWNGKTKETFIKLFSDKSYDHIHDIKMDVPDDGHEEPHSLAYVNNKYFVSFLNMDNVYVFNENGGLLYTFGGKGKKEGQFDLVRGLAVFGKDMLAVCDRNNHRVQVFSQSGHFLTSFGSYGSRQGKMDVPIDIAITQDEKVFVLELDGKRVQEWK